MPLDPATLETELAERLRSNFEAGKEEQWSVEQASDALAKAIADTVHAYVSAARVAGVQTQVRDAGNTVIGTGSQTGSTALS